MSRPRGIQLANMHRKYIPDYILPNGEVFAPVVHSIKQGVKYSPKYLTQVAMEGIIYKKYKSKQIDGFEAWIAYKQIPEINNILHDDIDEKWNEWSDTSHCVNVGGISFYKGTDIYPVMLQALNCREKKTMLTKLNWKTIKKYGQKMVQAITERNSAIITEMRQEDCSHPVIYGGHE